MPSLSTCDNSQKHCFPEEKNIKNSFCVSNGLDPDQDRPTSVLIRVQTVRKSYQWMTNVAASKNILLKVLIIVKIQV